MQNYLFASENSQIIMFAKKNMDITKQVVFLQSQSNLPKFSQYAVKSSQILVHSENFRVRLKHEVMK